MKNFAATILLCMCVLTGAQATVSRTIETSAKPMTPGMAQANSRLNIQRGQKFWDGAALYTAHTVTAAGDVTFAVSMLDANGAPVDGVSAFRLVRLGGAGQYRLESTGSFPPPFRCKWGAKVEFVRQNGMNFLAVKNSRGTTVEVLTLTPDNLRNCDGQQRQMEKDAIGDFNMVADGLLLNTHTLMPVDMASLQSEYVRLSGLAKPDIIQRTNCQMIAGELAYRNGEAEGGYDNPGGMADDGRDPTEIDPRCGEVVQYDGQQYLRVTNAEQFVHSIISGQSILVAKNTTINLTSILNDAKEWNTATHQWRLEGSTEVGNRPTIISEEMFDGRQLTIANHKQIVICGEGNSKIVVDPRYAFVLNFVNCEQIEIRNLTIGHTEGGHCEGGVIGVNGGWRISIQHCDLYGCGTYGVQLESTRDFSMASSIIRDCTYGIMTLRNVEYAKFDNCDFFRNREFSLVESRQSNVLFWECRFYANQYNSKLFDFDRQFSLDGCVINHPKEHLGSIDLADQDRCWFKDDPNDEHTVNRNDIGPDVEKVK